MKVSRLMGFAGMFAAAVFVGTTCLAAVSSAVCYGPSGRCGADDAVRPLFENGRSAWVVVVPDGAARPLRYAAEELTNVIRKVSGATLGVTSGSATPRRNAIRLVADGNAREDVFSVKTAPGEIELRGNSPRGALFAAYAFLRDWLGCRWYWPGADGEYLPTLARFDVTGRSREYRPCFPSRELSICTVWRHRHPDTERWFARVFLNGGLNTPEIKDDLGFERRASGHYISLPVPKEERSKVFEAHPDWFSLIDGKRALSGIAGCWSNEGYFDYLVSNLTERARAERLDTANFFVADIMPRCQCPSCTANPDKSSRFWSYYARLIDGIRRTLPDLRFCGLAYQEYRAVPDVPVRGLDNVEYCHYNRCYYHRLDDPSCAKNAKSMAEFRAWGEKAPLALYGYGFDAFLEPAYLPAWDVIADEMRVFRGMGLKRVKSELHVTLDKLAAKKNPLPPHRILQLTSRLAFYAWATLAFDPDVSTDEILRDFCGHVYGAGAAEMEAYHRLMAKRWCGMPNHLTYFFRSLRGEADVFLTDEIDRAARAHLSAAAIAARGDARASGQVALDAAAFEDWRTAAKDARTKGVMLDLKEYRDDAFAMVPRLVAKTRKRNKKPQETYFRIYRGTDALHVMSDCEERDLDVFSPGTAEHDVANWGLPSIEMLIDTGDGVPWQIAVSPAGGVWDRKGDDVSRDCGLKASPIVEQGHWRLTMSIPYAGLGATPASGGKWKFLIIRNVGESSKFATCGWPIDSHGDFGSAATLVFR